MFENLMEALRVDREGPGRARTRPDRAMAAKAYSSKGIRSYLRTRGIQCVIPEKEDQKANRKLKGSAGGRPSPTTRKPTNAAMSSNAASTPSSNGADWPHATTNSPKPTGRPPSCKPSSSGPQH